MPTNAALPATQSDDGVTSESSIQPQTPDVGDVPNVDETALPSSQAEIAEPVQSDEPVESVSAPSAEDPQPSVEQVVEAPAEPANEEAPVVDFSTPTIVETPSQTTVETVAEAPSTEPSDADQTAPSEPVVVVSEDGSIMQPVTSFADRDDEEEIPPTDDDLAILTW